VAPAGRRSMRNRHPTRDVGSPPRCTVLQFLHLAAGMIEVPLEALAADLRPGCEPHESRTNVGTVQRVSAPVPIDTTGLGDRSLGWTSTAVALRPSPTRLWRIEHMFATLQSCTTTSSTSSLPATPCSGLRRCTCNIRATTTRAGATTGPGQPPGRRDQPPDQTRSASTRMTGHSTSQVWGAPGSPSPPPGPGPMCSLPRPNGGIRWSPWS
jgi:hypothetical protein